MWKPYGLPGCPGRPRSILMGLAGLPGFGWSGLPLGRQRVGDTFRQPRGQAQARPPLTGKAGFTQFGRGFSILRQRVGDTFRQPRGQAQARPPFTGKAGFTQFGLGFSILRQPLRPSGRQPFGQAHLPARVGNAGFLHTTTFSQRPRLGFSFVPRGQAQRVGETLRAPPKRQAQARPLRTVVRVSHFGLGA